MADTVLVHTYLGSVYTPNQLVSRNCSRAISSEQRLMTVLPKQSPKPTIMTERHNTEPQDSSSPYSPAKKVK